MNLPQQRVHQLPEHFGIPKGDRTEDGEQASSEQYVVKVRDDEVGIVEVDVDGGARHEHAGEPTDHEHRHERDGV